MTNWWAKLLAILVTIVALGIIIFLSIGVTQPSYYQGKEILLSIFDSDLQITANNNTPLISIEGYSESYFQFQSEKDKTIIFASPLVTPPLSWTEKSCFYMKAEITLGNWQGSGRSEIIISIKSQEDINLTVIPNQRVAEIIAIVMLGLLAWMLLFAIIIALDDRF